MLRTQRAKVVVALIVLAAGWLGVSQIRFEQDDMPVHAGAPANTAVPADLQAFLAELEKAYGSKDSADVGRHLASDFLYQGMDRKAFLHHLKTHQDYLGPLRITPLAFAVQRGAIRLEAFAHSTHGAVPFPLHLLPLHSSTELVQEQGAWKLRGDLQRLQSGAYHDSGALIADFIPADLDTYRRHIPAGFAMPDKPFVRVQVTNVLKAESPQAPYRTIQLGILVKKEHEELWHVLAAPNSDWLAAENAKAIGLPGLHTPIAAKKSLAKHWTLDVGPPSQVLARIAFDPYVTTKFSSFATEWPSNTDDLLAFKKDGTAMKVLARPLIPQARPKQSFGRMTVHGFTAPWSKLLRPGSSALALAVDMPQAVQVHTYPMQDAQVPPDVTELLDRLASAWSRREFGDVQAQLHPAFFDSSQRRLAIWRAVFSISRKFEWKVKDIRIEGDAAHLYAEVQTDVGNYPTRMQLIREGGRWQFYGDGNLPGQGGPADTSGISTSVQSAADAAFRYGFALNETMRVCDKYRSLNTLVYGDKLATHLDRNVVRPNNDTLYATACIYVGASWVLLTMPPSKDRYMSLQILDAYTNTVALQNSTQAPARSAQYVLRMRGSDSAGMPPGVPVIDLPTPYAFFIARTLVNGPSDVAAADALQRQILMKPNSNDNPQRTANVEGRTAAQDFFLKLKFRLAQNPPPASEQAFIASLAAAGITPSSFPSINDIDEEQRKAWEVAYANGPQILAAAVGERTSARGTWKLPKPIPKDFGRDYAYRALIARYGIFALPAQEAIYPTTAIDRDGIPLDGNFSYTLHLPAAWPPIDSHGFWSLTMYDQDGFLAANPMQRYSIGNRTPGIRYEADGSLRLYLQCADPGGLKSANWLPSPCGPFNVTMRLYLPTAAASDTGFTLPPITKN